MARAAAVRWAICCIVVVASVDLATPIGVNWGRQSSHPLKPNTVVQMLQDNGYKKVKLFDGDSYSLSALAGSGLEVMVGIPNLLLQRISGSYSIAQSWVKENVTKHISDKGGVDIRYVAVGNEPFLTAYKDQFSKAVLPAMQSIQKALNDAGHKQIKVVVPQNADVYNSTSEKPSDGDFRKDVKDQMKQILKFLQDNGSPFVVNIYPFISLYENDQFPLDFAFFQKGNQFWDNGKKYDNVFDANYDTLVSTLKRYGYSSMKIIVGEIGWPSDGNRHATKALAQKFYDGLFKHMAASHGTPLRPGKLLDDIYLFGLLDEDQKSIEPGLFERHWGIFQYDGQPKFPIDITGGGNLKMPIAAKGVDYYPSQWCVVDENYGDVNELGNSIGYACQYGDCSALAYGSSCGDLDKKGNASYAFNMYYQINEQDVTACNFKGAAKIVKQNASVGDCLFPIMVDVSYSAPKMSFLNTYGVAIVSGLAFFLLASL